MMKSNFRCAFQILTVAIVATALVSAAGCGAKSLTTISGKVTLDGEPVKEGSIQFLPTGEGTPEGASIVDGAYTSKVSPGQNKVKIFASKEDPTKTVPNIDPSLPPVPAVVEMIPKNYNDETTLTITVVGGETHDFDLKTK